MPDDRKTSASDELIGRARGGAAAGHGEFTLESPSYDDVLGLPDPEDHGSGDSYGDMSAEEIAAQLVDMGAVDTVEVEPEPEPEPEPVVEAASLPAWATQEPAAEPDSVPAADAPAIEQASVDPLWSDASPTGDVDDRWNSATPEWEAYQAQRDAKRAKRNTVNFPLPSVRVLIGLGVAAFLFLPLLFNFATGREHISSVDVGDCFVAGTAFEVETVPVVDCAEEHDQELFAKVDATAFGVDFPGEDFLFEWAYEECILRFEGYVGEPYADSPYYIETFIPLEDGWHQGDRTALCSVVVVDSNLETVLTTGSRRGIGGIDDA